MGGNLHDEDAEDVMQAWDDVPGLELDPEEVAKARRKEIDFIVAKGV